MKWQKSARLVMVGVALATIAGVVVTMRKRQAPPAAADCRAGRSQGHGGELAAGA